MCFCNNVSLMPVLENLCGRIGEMGAYRTFVEVTGENLVEVLLVPYLFEILELFFHAPLVE